MADARIDVVIGAQQAQAGAAAVTRAVNGIKSGFLDLTAKIFVAQQTVDRFWKLASQGATFEETMGRLNRQMGSFHSTAQVMVNDLQAITNHTLSIDKAAMMASRALATGLDPDQIKTFVQAADVLDDVLGTDLPQAFDQIVQASITGRSQVLANIGVYVDLEDEVKKLAVSTGRTTDQITKQERAMIAAKAIISQTGDALEKLTDGALSDADKLKQVEAQWDNLMTTIGIGVKTMVLDSLGWVGRLRAALAGITANLQSSVGPRALQGFGIGQGDIDKAIIGSLGDASTLQQDDVWQEILGRAIVSDAQGRLGKKPTVRREPPKPPPTALLGGQLDAERDRRTHALQGDLDREKRYYETIGQMRELDAQRQEVSQVQLVRDRTTLDLFTLQKTGENLTHQLELEKDFHDRRVKIGFDTIEEKIAEEQRFASKVSELNEQMVEVEHQYAMREQVGDAQAKTALAEQARAIGQRMTDDFIAQYRIREDIRQRAFDDEQAWYQGQIDLQRAFFRSDEEIAAKERELLRSQLAFKLRLSEADTDKLLYVSKFSADRDEADTILQQADPTLSMRAKEGLTASAVAKDIELMERANGDFVSGWARGLQKYSQNTESVFGMAQDMARRAAQGMEQGFQRFFFDGMDGKFRSFKDVLQSVLDFTKQMVSQIAAQLLTVGIINPSASAFGSWFSGSSGAGISQYSEPAGPISPIYQNRFGGVMPVERYAEGGITSRPQLALFGEGAQSEAFVPLPDGRSIPVTMRYAGNLPMPVPAGGTSVSVPIDIQIINQTSAKVETQRQAGADGKQQIRVLIREEVKSGFNDGSFDQQVGRYGTKPRPFRR